VSLVVWSLVVALTLVSGIMLFVMGRLAKPRSNPRR
jgi:hypothetical protein